jgi:APA family basic amino acid/polyamine antiporter
MVSIISTLGINLSPQLLNPPGVAGGFINLPAVIIIGIISLLLIRGTKFSLQVNSLIVVLKLFVVLLFITIGVSYINPANYHPFLPFGYIGIFKGAAIIFFAYIGFDAITTAAEEVKNPQRTFPIVIIGSLLIASVLYVIVTTVLNGMVPYYMLGGAAPVAFALNAVGVHWADIVISVGALAGLTSVILVGFFGEQGILCHGEGWFITIFLC